MKAHQAAAVVLCLALVPPARSAEPIMAQAPVPSPAATAAWVAKLRCGDLLTPDGKIEWNTMLPFSLWIHGYFTGVASSLPLDRLTAKPFPLFEWTKLEEVSALVLTRCHEHRDLSAVDVVIDAAGFSANMASKRPVKLRGPDGKWE
jgi:hypothetical protein